MTWDQLESELEKLAGKITEKPAVIVAIARGGLIPARLLARNLKVKTIYVLTIEKINSSRKLVTKIEADINNQKVLLVEDSLETGNNLLECRLYLESLGAKVNTAALYISKGTKILPDYWLKRREILPHFPWE